MKGMTKERLPRLSKPKKKTKAKLMRRTPRGRKPKRKPLKRNLRAKLKNLPERKPQEMKLWSEKSML